MKIQAKKIVVGLSGGVDSAVSAYLLQQQGHEVTGVYMQNWETENDDPHCHGQQDLSDARAVCDQLQIPFRVVNFAKQYWDQVFQYCLDEFAAGRTPNPDIGCNKEIKFKVFLQYALQLGADCLATGHYAQIHDQNGAMQLLRSEDAEKDQSYFLYTLGQAELAKSLFPVGHLVKHQVRELARTAGLINHAKKDSTGICFIGERRFKQFLNEFLLAQPGLMKTPEGKTIGQHDGVMFYTIGQRRGLNIGGQKDAAESGWYVLAKDIPNNILIVGQGHDHPLLYSSRLICNQVHWVSGQAPDSLFSCTAKIRYRQKDTPCQITPLSNDMYQVDFNQPQRAITPGQSIVFYQGPVCLGGGIILRSSH